MFLNSIQKCKYFNFNMHNVSNVSTLWYVKSSTIFFLHPHWAATITYNTTRIQWKNRNFLPWHVSCPPIIKLSSLLRPVYLLGQYVSYCKLRQITTEFDCQISPWKVSDNCLIWNKRNYIMGGKFISSHFKIFFSHVGGSDPSFFYGFSKIIFFFNF